MNLTTAAVPLEESNYFEFLLELRRKEEERQKNGSDYKPPDCDDFKVWKGVKKISKTMQKLHPAYEVFMEWREGEMIKENIEAERRWFLLQRGHGHKDFFCDVISHLRDCDKNGPNDSSSELYDKYAGFLYDDNFEESLRIKEYDYFFRKFRRSWSSYLLCEARTSMIALFMNGYIKGWEERMEIYKKRAHRIRLLQKKDEIRRDAKKACSSCGDVEDAVAEHLDHLYEAINHNPVNYGCTRYRDLHPIARILGCNSFNWTGLYPEFNPSRSWTLLYAHFHRNRRLFPNLTLIEKREKIQCHDCEADTIEFSSNLLITHQNLPIP